MYAYSMGSYMLQWKCYQLLLVPTSNSSLGINQKFNKIQKYTSMIVGTQRDIIDLCSIE